MLVLTPCLYVIIFLNFFCRIVSGKAVLDLARPIVASLVQELKDHSLSATQAVFQAISDLTALLGKPNV